MTRVACRQAGRAQACKLCRHVGHDYVVMGRAKSLGKQRGRGRGELSVGELLRGCIVKLELRRP